MTGALLTDQYELTMAASYYKHGMNGMATFDLFVRELPANRNFLVFAGVEDALDHLETLRFEIDDVDYLRSLEVFDDAFLGHLADLRFTGEVWAMPEGEIFFGNEPVLTVTAPLIEAQIVETYLLNAITFPSSIASKAARIQIAARGRSFVDFSLGAITAPKPDSSLRAPLTSGEPMRPRTCWPGACMACRSPGRWPTRM